MIRRGDIVINHWASPNYNDLHVVIGNTTVGGRDCYNTRCLFKGKLTQSKSAFSKSDNRLEVIGHVDLDAYIIEAMEKARLSYDHTK